MYKKIKSQLLRVSPKDLLNKYDSNKIIKKVVTFSGSGGGGRKDLAQGGAQLSKNSKNLNQIQLNFYKSSFSI